MCSRQTLRIPEMYFQLLIWLWLIPLSDLLELPNSVLPETSGRISWKRRIDSLISYSVFSKTPVPVALIYATCAIPGKTQPEFSPWRSKIPTIQAECDMKTRGIDCNEAVPYLNFIIENYDNPIADRYIFVHGHDRAWHHTANLFDALEKLMQLTYWQENSFGGVFYRFYARGPWGNDEEDWAEPLYREIFVNTSMPKDPQIMNNQRPCCATFWFDSKLIKNRQKKEYILIRDRLRNWSLHHAYVVPNPGYYCGRTMEYNWHILLTKKSLVQRCWDCL